MTKKRDLRERLDLFLGDKRVKWYWRTILAALTVLVSAFILILAFEFVKQSYLSFKLTLVQEFGSFVVDVVIGYTLTFIVIAVLVHFVVFSIYPIKKYRWLYWALALSLLAILVGTPALQQFYGTPHIELPLYYVNDTSAQYGVLRCENDDAQVEIGTQVLCKFDPPFNNDSGVIDLIFANGTREPIAHSHWSFIAPADVRRLEVRATGYDPAEIEHSLHARGSARFYTADELAQRRDRFFGLFVALIGIVLFSVPTVVYSIRKLSEP